MLFVDRRIGSNDLHPIFQHMGLPTSLTTLEFGDCAWTGIGEEGPVEVGVEVKRLDDLLQSMQSGRLAGHQLPGLLSSYDRIYLVVEDATRPGESGVLEQYVRGKWWHQAKVGHRGFTYRSYEKFLTTLMERGNLRLRQTVDRQGTAECIASLYQWWMDGYDAHSSVLTLDKTTQIKLADHVRQECGGGVSLLRRGPSLKRRIAAELPGIGVDRSKAVADYFSSVADMVGASEKDWLKVKGVGKGIAKGIVEAVRRKE